MKRTRLNRAIMVVSRVVAIAIGCLALFIASSELRLRSVRAGMSERGVRLLLGAPDLVQSRDTSSPCKSSPLIYPGELPEDATVYFYMMELRATAFVLFDGAGTVTRVERAAFFVMR